MFGNQSGFSDGEPTSLGRRFSFLTLRVASRLGMPIGRNNGGYVIHSFRHFFERLCVNSGIPQRVIDTWLGHRSDKSMGSVYYSLGDDESQAFMMKVPFFNV